MADEDEGRWQPRPSQAEGEREGDSGGDWQPIPEQPAEGGREVVDEAVEDDS